MRRLDIDHTSSIDPHGLQLIAIEDALLGADEAVMSRHLGVRHPRRLALAARRGALAAEIERAREVVAVNIEASGLVRKPVEKTAPRVADEAPAGDPSLRARAVALASVLARLVELRDTARPARWLELGSCHVQR